MRKLNFDSQRLPPFLVGYLVDGKIGEREIIATIMDLVQRGIVFIRKDSEDYLLRVEKSKTKNRFEQIIVSVLGQDEHVAQSAMNAMRSKREDIYAAFKTYLKSYYESITQKKVSLIFISLTMSVTVNEDVSELRRTFGENHILPKLPEKDKRALSDLVAFLENNPVNPENIAAEFLPYSVALGHNNYWMGKFKADTGQRNIIPDFFEGMPKSHMPRKTGIYYYKEDRTEPK